MNIQMIPHPFSSSDTSPGHTSTVGHKTSRVTLKRQRCYWPPDSISKQYGSRGDSDFCRSQPAKNGSDDSRSFSRPAGFSSWVSAWLEENSTLSPSQLTRGGGGGCVSDKQSAVTRHFCFAMRQDCIYSGVHSRSPEIGFENEGFGVFLDGRGLLFVKGKIIIWVKQTTESAFRH